MVKSNMEIANTLGKTVFFCWCICLSSAVVHLNVVENEIQLGKHMHLSCEIKHDTITGSRKWLGGTSLGMLCLNGISADPTKYIEVKVSVNKYLLNITEVSKRDLNCHYVCGFGFLRDEIFLSLNESNFKYVPASNTTHVEYYKENGIYNLSFRFDQVFPVPSCKVNTKHPLSTTPAVRKEPNDIFYRVGFSYVSNESLHSCDTPVEIECNIKDEKYIIRHQHNLTCSHSTPTSNKNSESNSMVITFSIISVLICIITAGVLIRCRKNQGPRKLVKRKDNFVLGEPLNTEKNTNSSIVEKKSNVDIAGDRMLSETQFSDDMIVTIPRI